MRTPSVVLLAAATLGACGPKLPQQVDAFLTSYDSTFQRLYYASAQAEWASNTHIVEGDSTNAVRTKAANKALKAKGLAEITGWAQAKKGDS